MEMFKVLFSWYDYTLFILVLTSSAAIGIYFGIVRKQSSAKEYLLGGQKMTPFPVAMSLISSMISGITLLAVPADVYRYGAAYWLLCPVMIFVVLVTYYVYLPVFYKLQIKSTNEYFNLRFNAKIQMFASVLYTISNLLYLPIVIYIPALALAQATGFSNIHLITPIICGICIFYTTLGGLKAVIWTDTLQFILMIIAMVVVFIMGIMTTGGFLNIWQISKEHGRLDVDLGIDFTKRETLLSGTIGMLTLWISYISVNQGLVQKCMSLPTYAKVKSSLLIFLIGMIIVVSFCVFTGLIIFARYVDCDPLSAGLVQQSDQLLPYYVLDVAREIPGLPGLFVSGIFSAALSTLSAVINCMACTIYEDFIAPYLRKDISDKKVSLILKWLVVIVGLVNTGLVFVVEHLGGLLPLTFSLSGVTAGPLLGLFTVGMLFPMVDSTGALWGGVISLIVMTAIVCGQQWYQSQGQILYPMLPLSVDGCINITNASRMKMDSERLLHHMDEKSPILFTVSYYWYSLMGVAILVFVSVIVSAFNKKKEKRLNKDLFSPVIYPLLSKTTLDYYSAVQATNMDTCVK